MLTSQEINQPIMSFHAMLEALAQNRLQAATLTFTDLQPSESFVLVNDVDNAVCCLATLQHNGNLYLASGANDIKLWDVRNRSCRATLQGHTNSVLGLTFFERAGNIYLASGSADNSIIIWDLANNSGVTVQQRIQEGGEHTEVKCLTSYKHEEQIYLASGSTDGLIKIWAMATNTCVATLEAAGLICSLACFKHNEQTYLVSGSWDGTLKVWDVSTNSCIATTQTASSVLSLTSYEQNGKIIVAGGSYNGAIVLWEMAPHPVMVATLLGQPCLYGLKHLHHAEKNYLVSGGWGAPCTKIWDLATNTCVATLEEPVRNKYEENDSVVHSVAAFVQGEHIFVCSGLKSGVMKWRELTYTNNFSFERLLRLLQAIKANRSLITLNFGTLDLRQQPNGVAALIEAISNHPSLNVINLREVAIAQQEYPLFYKGLCRWVKQPVLFEEQNKAVVKTIYWPLTVPVTLTEIMKLREKGRQAGNTVLIQLHEQTFNLFQYWQLAVQLRLAPSLNSVDLRNLQLNADTLEICLGALRHQPLAELDLSNNPLGDSPKTAEVLCKFLTEQQNVQAVNLNNTQLGEVVGETLVRLLVQTTHLRALKIAGNSFSSQIGKRLIAALFLNATLEHLEVKETDWSKGIFEHVAYLMQLKKEYDKKFPEINEARINHFKQQFDNYFKNRLVIQQNHFVVDFPVNHDCFKCEDKEIRDIFLKITSDKNHVLHNDRLGNNFSDRPANQLLFEGITEGNLVKVFIAIIIGADTNAKVKSNQWAGELTPLHIVALYRGHNTACDIAKLLIAKGADKKIRAIRGNRCDHVQTAEEMARSYNANELADTIRDAPSANLKIIKIAREKLFEAFEASNSSDNINPLKKIYLSGRVSENIIGVSYENNDSGAYTTDLWDIDNAVSVKRFNDLASRNILDLGNNLFFTIHKPTYEMVLWQWKENNISEVTRLPFPTLAKITFEQLDKLHFVFKALEQNRFLIIASNSTTQNSELFVFDYSNLLLNISCLHQITELQKLEKIKSQAKSVNFTVMNPSEKIKISKLSFNRVLQNKTINLGYSSKFFESHDRSSEIISSNKVHTLNTRGDGNCFFHSVFGTLNNKGCVVAENAQEYRQQWHDALVPYHSLADERMPPFVREQLRIIFDRYLENPERGVELPQPLQHLLQEIIRRKEVAELRQQDYKNRIYQELLRINDPNVSQNMKNIFIALIKKVYNGRSTNQEYTNIITAVKQMLNNTLPDNEEIIWNNRAALLIVLNRNGQFLKDKIGDEWKNYIRLYDNNFPVDEINDINNEFYNSEELYAFYLREILKKEYYVFFEEIPLLATLFNVTVTLHREEQEPLPFHPDQANIRYNRNTPRVATISYAGNHYEQVAPSQHVTTKSLGN